MRVLLLDNYDSFTFNLKHLIEKVSDYQVDVFKNDQIELVAIDKYQKIVLSPGPGLPKDAGIMSDLLKMYSHSKSILGVCLGMQAIAENFNSPLKNLETVYHGIATKIEINHQDKLFKNCPKSFFVGRYHSWVVDDQKISEELKVIAQDEKNLIMAIRHKRLNIYGVQFHPESILSQFGETIIHNWINS